MVTIESILEYVKNPEYRKELGLNESDAEDYSELARGEYNINYIFHPSADREPLLLRVNCGSQMHLANQIEYEAQSLELLLPSNRTPEVYYVDGSSAAPGNGALVMEYLPGQQLDYKDCLSMKATAECLADIHCVKLSEDNGLIAPELPMRAMLEECEEMLEVYLVADIAPEDMKLRLRNLLDEAWRLIRDEKIPEYRCCINTELNSSNFLVDKRDDECTYVRLIDWEKPLYADPAQDLGHFLAPTTTFWKTDVILSEEEIDAFLDEYVDAVAARFDTGNIRDRAKKYILITCLRGLTWCAMAWVQYQHDDDKIKNEFTWNKLQDYLSDEFVGNIEKMLY